MNLNCIRKSKGISRKELAERVGVTERRLEGWEYGEREPDIKHLIALADALECTVDQLVRDEKPIHLDGKKIGTLVSETVSAQLTKMRYWR